MTIKFPKAQKEDVIHIKMNISVDLPAEMADQLETLGIYEFEKCVYDQSRRNMTATVSTELYRKGA